jgi:hypothetical protein
MNENLSSTTQSLMLAGSCFNWLATLLGIIAAAIPYWTWGYTSPHQQPAQYSSATVCTSPWIAGFPLQQQSSSCPTGCVPYTDVMPVYWSQIVGTSIPCSSSMNSTITIWANSYGGSCHAVPLSNGKTDVVYAPPTAPIHVQGLIVASIIFAILAAIVACGTAFDEYKASQFTMPAFLLSLIAWILFTATFSLFVDWSFCNQMMKSTGAYIPIWSGTQFVVVNTQQTYGPGLGCAVAAFCLSFVATVIHIAANFVDLDYIDTTTNDSKNTTNKSNDMGDLLMVKNTTSLHQLPQPPLQVDTADSTSKELQQA